MRERKVGLTLGKFAPLHRGHQLMIETAIAEMDEVIVVIYDCPETTPVPLTVRANWLRVLYPDVQVVEAWDGPTVIGDTPEIKAMHEQYILTLLQGRRVTHFYSSEFYGDHMSVALGAVNRLVDPKRAAVPISGTKIREAPYRCREYLHPIVYRDLIVKAVFLGAPSTGKTTLAAHLAKELNTAWMPEYGREYWERHQSERRLTSEQLEDIARGHLEREDEAALAANEVLFVDTNAITTYMFARYYHGGATDGLERLALLAQSRYDLVFVCDTDIPYEDSWDRSGEANRYSFQKQILSDLRIRKLPFTILSGTLEQRAAEARGRIGDYCKRIAHSPIPYSPT